MTQSMEPFLKEGAQIGVFEIKDVIRTDDFSITYRALNRHLNAQVAMMEYYPSYLVKRKSGNAVVPRPEARLEDYHFGLQQFIQHAEILQEIKHQNIVAVHNVLKFNQTAYMVMDYVNGVLLSKRQDHSPSFTEDELTLLQRSLLSALQTLHNNGSIHGDIHPSNILLTEKGAPVFINFSAARLAFAAHSKNLANVLRSGYAAPELYKPGNLPGPSSDLYALGATLFSCMTQTDPIAALEREKQLSRKQPDPHQAKLDEAASALNETLVKTISWMFQLNTAHRAGSASKILELMDQISEDNPTKETAKARMDSDLKADADQTNSAKSAVGLLLGSIMGIVVLGALGFWFFQENRQSELVTSSEQSQTSTSMKKKKIAEITESQPKKTIPDTEFESKLVENQKVSPEPLPSEPDKTETAPGIPIDKMASIEEPPQEAPKSPDETENSSIIEENKDAMIKQHLAIANDHMEALRLSTPPDQNAYQQYQAVLEIDPDNTDAKKGLEKIADLYLWFINSAIQKGNLQTAEIYLNRAEKIIPDNPELQRLRKAIATHGHSFE